MHQRYQRVSCAPCPSAAEAGGVALKSIHNFYMHEVTEAFPSFKLLQWLLLPSFLHGLLPEARVTGARNVAVFQMDPVLRVIWVALAAHRLHDRRLSGRVCT